MGRQIPKSEFMWKGGELDNSISNKNLNSTC